ncbi:MAG: helix-turn-helix transcriptional regulator [Magnetococcales bacterium]|nr:helix-turn-helix transcriptional regulator [Magnetococcales bacterium]
MISSRLRALRRELDLTQQELSERIGVSRAYIADVEAGRKEPSRNFIVKLTDHVHISGDWLLSGSGEMFLEGAKGTVRDRLVRMLAATERDVEGWLHGLGVGHPHTASLEVVNGDIWNQRFIERVCRLEGMRDAWLLHGEGSPFPGGRMRHDEEAVKRLRELLSCEERGWHVYLVTDRAVFCVVMIAPAWSEQSDGQTDDYTLMEVIGGSVGRRTLSEVRGLLGSLAIYVLVVPSASLRRLVNGWLGVREFMGSGRMSGLIDGAIRIERETQVGEYIPEPLAQIDAVLLESACKSASEEQRTARILYWLATWLPNAGHDERIFLEGLLRRNFPEFGEQIWESGG